MPPPGSDPALPCRCRWAGIDPLYCAYHDDEWGVPEHDSRALWETMVLEGFQAGLAWITILRKREAFRSAFARFDPERVARFGPVDVARLMADPGIIRSRAKIEASLASARVYLAMQNSGEDFARFVWSFTAGTTVQNVWTGDGDVPAETAASRALSKALRSKGFKFVGPVIAYAWMQASGLVNDHVVTCFRHTQLR